MHCGDRTMPTLLDDAVAGDVLLAGQLHPVLLDEGSQQRVHRIHDGGVAMNFEMAVLFNRAYALLLHIAGHHAGKRAPQVGCQQVAGLVPVQPQVAHVFMSGHERLLELVVNL